MAAAAASDNICINTILPPEILVNIFNSFPLDDQVTLCGVCRLWRDIIYDQFRSRKYLQYSNSAHGLLQQDGEVFQRVTRIDVELRKAEDVGKLCDLVDRVHVLHHLHLVYDLRGAAAEMSAYYDRLRKESALAALESLRFDVTKYADDRAARLLRALMFPLHKRGAAATACSLKKFICNQLQVENDESLCRTIMDVLAGTSSQLSHLTLYKCKLHHRVARKFENYVGGLKDLEHLDVRDSNIVLSKSLVDSITKHCSKLTSFGISSRYEGPSNNVFPALSKFKCTAGEFVVRSRDDINVLALQRVLTHVDAIKVEQSLSANELVSLAACGHFQLPLTVDEVDLRSVRHAATDDLLKMFNLGVWRVKKINASWCQKVTNTGVARLLELASLLELSSSLEEASLVDSSSSLEVLLLRGVTNISTQLLDLLAHVRRSKPVEINVWETALSEEMKDNVIRTVTTGANNNIRVDWSYNGRK